MWVCQRLLMDILYWQNAITYWLQETYNFQHMQADHMDVKDSRQKGSETIVPLLALNVRFCFVYLFFVFKVLYYPGAVFDVEN